MWDLDFSPWLRICVSCDNNGVIAGSMLQDMVTYQPDTKYRNKQFVVSMSHVKSKTSTPKDNESKVTDKVKSSNMKKCKSKQSDKRVKSNKKSKDSETDVYNDVPNRSNVTDSSHLQDRVQHEQHKLAETLDQCYIQYEDPQLIFDRTEKEFDHYEYPLKALYRVCFSPNLHSCNWLAYGGHAGLLRWLDARVIKPSIDLGIIKGIVNLAVKRRLNSLVVQACSAIE
ncbi:hypothetical protein ScPMuIL_009262 [Solemya velum]